MSDRRGWNEHGKGGGGRGRLVFSLAGSPLCTARATEREKPARSRGEESRSGRVGKRKSVNWRGSVRGISKGGQLSATVVETVVGSAGVSAESSGQWIGVRRPSRGRGTTEKGSQARGFRRQSRGRGATERGPQALPHWGDAQQAEPPHRQHGRELNDFDGQGGEQMAGDPRRGEEGKQQHEEEAEAFRPRMTRQPEQQARKETEEHELTHRPDRRSCDKCVQGQARNNPRRGCDEEEKERK